MLFYPQPELPGDQCLGVAAKDFVPPATEEVRAEIALPALRGVLPLEGCSLLFYPQPELPSDQRFSVAAKDLVPPATEEVRAGLATA